MFTMGVQGVAGVLFEVRFAVLEEVTDPDNGEA